MIFLFEVKMLTEKNAHIVTLLLQALGWDGPEQSSLLAIAENWNVSNNTDEWFDLFPPLRRWNATVMGKLEILSRRLTKVEAGLQQKLEIDVAEGLARELREINGFCSKTAEQHRVMAERMEGELKGLYLKNQSFSDKATKLDVQDVSRMATAENEALRLSVEEIRNSVKALQSDFSQWQAVNATSEDMSTMPLRASRPPKSSGGLGEGGLSVQHVFTKQRTDGLLRPYSASPMGGGIGMANVVPGPLPFGVQLRLPTQRGLQKSAAGPKSPTSGDSTLQPELVNDYVPLTNQPQPKPSPKAKRRLFKARVVKEIWPKGQ